MSGTLSSLGLGGSGAETVTLAELDRRLEAAVKSGRAPGIVFGAVRTNGERVVRAVGRASLAPPREATGNTAFSWFSLTKLFTATAVVQLAENGRVDLDSPVATVLPKRRLERNGRHATIRNLLSHSAGLGNPIPITWVHLLEEEGPGLDALTNRVVGVSPGLAYEPGSKSVYSNPGYLLLGQIVEEVTGEGFAAYVERHVLGPLGCKATGFVPHADGAIGYQRRMSPMGLAARWVLDRRFFGEAIGSYRALRPFVVDGAPYGGLVGPVSDLLRLALAMLTGGRTEDGRVLGELWVRSMLAPATSLDGGELPVGLGWHLGKAGDDRYAYHLGGGGGFRSELRIYPKLGYGVAILANETSFPTSEFTRLVVR